MDDWNGFQIFVGFLPPLLYQQSAVSRQRNKQLFSYLRLVGNYTDGATAECAIRADSEQDQLLLPVGYRAYVQYKTELLAFTNARRSLIGLLVRILFFYPVFHSSFRGGAFPRSSLAAACCHRKPRSSWLSRLSMVRLS